LKRKFEVELRLLRGPSGASENLKGVPNFLSN
jgi:hypothetical protein